MSIFDEQEAKKPYVEGESNFELPPEGTHSAVLVAMVDLGTHVKEFNGQRNSYRKVYLAWELVDEQKKDGTNFVIGREFTLSFADSAGLRHMIEKWNGKKFAPGEKPRMSALLGKSCNLSVIHGTAKQSGRSYANVDLVSPLKKGEKTAAPTYKPFFWEIGSPGDPPTHSWLPFLFGEPLVDWIKRSPEWAKREQAQQGQQRTVSRQQEVDEVLPTSDDADPFPPEEKPATAPAPAKPKMRLPNDPATRKEIDEIDALLGQLELDWETASKRCNIACEFTSITYGQYRLLRAMLSTELEMKQPAEIPY